MKKKYSERIMRCVRQRWGLEADDTSKDELIMEQEPTQIIEDYFAWLGIIGYGYEIVDVVSEVLALSVEEK